MTFAVMAAALPASADVALGGKGLENPDKWIKTTFAKGVIPPFSFEYDGVSSDKFIRSWKYSISKTTAQDANAVQYSIIYKDPRSGLQVRAIVTGFSDTGAVEWVLRFSNAGSTDTGIISEVKTADFTLKDKGADGYMLRRLRGSSRAELATRRRRRKP